MGPKSEGAPEKQQYEGIRMKYEKRRKEKVSTPMAKMLSQVK